VDIFAFLCCFCPNWISSSKHNKAKLGEIDNILPCMLDLSTVLNLETSYTASYTAWIDWIRILLQNAVFRPVSGPFLVSCPSILFHSITRLTEYLPSIFSKPEEHHPQILQSSLSYNSRITQLSCNIQLVARLTKSPFFSKVWIVSPRAPLDKISLVICCDILLLWLFTYLESLYVVEVFVHYGTTSEGRRTLMLVMSEVIELEEPSCERLVAYWWWDLTLWKLFVSQWMILAC
jgi:hypothetical protein